MKTKLTYLQALPEDTEQLTDTAIASKRYWGYPDDLKRSLNKKGISEVRLAADPHAKGFYDKMGGVIIDLLESKVPGRFLPVYTFTTE